MEFVKAFLVGGVICALVQILMDNTKLMPSRIMVLLVVSGTILGALVSISRLRTGQAPEPQYHCSASETRSGRACGRAWERTDFWESLKAASPPVRWGSRER